MPTPELRRIATSGIAALVVLGAATASAALRSGPGPRTALAAENPVRSADGRVSIEVECSTDLEVEVASAAGIDGVPLVTVWGRPEAGRCRPTITMDVPISEGRFQDAASGMVLEVEGATAPGSSDTASRGGTDG